MKPPIQVLHVAFLLVLATPSLALARGAQSVLSPTGSEAEQILFLTRILLSGGLVILLGMSVLMTIALLGAPEQRRWLNSERTVIVGGLAFPVAVLTGLLAYDAFARTRPALGDAQQPVRIAVMGEQWWWRVIYPIQGGGSIETANELHIPVGRPVRIELATADVIHSFWVPPLSGKLDMIPGRTTVLTLMATQPGLSRGQCAEYCGGAHALMSFHVVALRPAEYDAWLLQQAAPANTPANASDERGMSLFLSSGCAGCHTIRGTDANGTIGPDLTHVGSRQSLAAATLLNNRESLAHWITDNQHIKPGNRMPPFGIFSEADLDALSGYLSRLR